MKRRAFSMARVETNCGRLMGSGRTLRDTEPTGSKSMGTGCRQGPKSPDWSLINQGGKGRPHPQARSERWGEHGSTAGLPPKRHLCVPLEDMPGTPTGGTIHRTAPARPMHQCCQSVRGPEGDRLRTERHPLLGPGQEPTAVKGLGGASGRRGWAAGPQVVSMLWPHRDPR